MSGARLSWPDRENDYVALIDGMTAARIMLGTFAGSVRKWTWIIGGPYIPAELQPSQGAEETLEAAVEALAWLETPSRMRGVSGGGWMG